MGDWIEILNRAGQTFDEGRIDDAGSLAEEGLRLNPHAGLGHQILGMVDVLNYRPRQAIEKLNHALALQPDLVPATCQLGVAHGILGDGETALKYFNRALRIKPDHIASRFNQAQLLLQMGRFREGWLGYEWRWYTKEVPRPNVPRPRWNGDSLNGKSILIHTEQGMGDTMQFVRFLGHLKQQGARITFACQTPLQPLLQCLSWVDEWFPIDREAPIHFEMYSPLMSLPGLLNVNSEEDIPYDGPYITAEPDRIDHWRPRIEALPGLKVGINWQGKPDQSRDRVRSCPLEKFEPLAKVEGVTLVALHKGAGESQIKEVGDRVPLTVFEGVDEDGAFVDTAAILTQLDLIISTDTAMVHLAGAMGRPVWVPLSTACDWRFMFDRHDSPWYPTMRLFRQKEFDVWDPVIEEMARELKKLVHGQPAALPRTPISVGELLDKITILEIKEQRIEDKAKLENVRQELSLLREVAKDVVPQSSSITELVAELVGVNSALWVIEDDIRACEAAQDFGQNFIELARKVYQTNDRRAEIKKRLNELLGSALVEEKSYGGM